MYLYIWLFSFHFISFHNISLALLPFGRRKSESQVASAWLHYACKESEIYGPHFILKKKERNKQMNKQTTVYAIYRHECTLPRTFTQIIGDMRAYLLRTIKSSSQTKTRKLLYRYSHALSLFHSHISSVQCIFLNSNDWNISRYDDQIFCARCVYRWPLINNRITEIGTRNVRQRFSSVKIWVKNHYNYKNFVTFRSVFDGAFRWFNLFLFVDILNAFVCRQLISLPNIHADKLRL